MELTDVARKFVVHWGEMGSAWGVNRTVAQIHALLFFHGRPIHAEEIAETLGVARSNVSNSLKELINWKLIRTTQILGDRRDYFETSSDVWNCSAPSCESARSASSTPPHACCRPWWPNPTLSTSCPTLKIASAKPCA